MLTAEGRHAHRRGLTNVIPSWYPLPTFTAGVGVLPKGYEMTKVTQRQEALIANLLRERDYTLTADVRTLSVSQASALISELFRAPKRVSAGRVSEAGMYRTADGTIYRVQASRGSGNLYAKRLLAGGGFEYVAGAIRLLTPADRMSLAEAQAFGVATGVCCVCGALLTDERSVTRGIGPVCAGKGWWRAGD